MDAVFSSDHSMLYVVDSDPGSPDLGGCIRTIDLGTFDVKTITPVTHGHKDGKITSLWRGAGFTRY